MGAGANKGKYVSRTFKHSSSLKNFVYKPDYMKYK